MWQTRQWIMRAASPTAYAAEFRYLADMSFLNMGIFRSIFISAILIREQWYQARKFNLQLLGVFLKFSL